MEARRIVRSALALGLASACSDPAPKPATLPVVSLSGPAIGAVGEPVSFEAVESKPGGTVLAFVFSFGDDTGTVSGPSPVAVHTYLRTGTYQPSVTLMDTRGGFGAPAALPGGIRIVDVLPDGGVEPPLEKKDGSPDLRDAPPDLPKDGPPDLPPDKPDVGPDLMSDLPADKPLDLPPDVPAGTYSEVVDTGACVDIRPSGTALGPLKDDDGVFVGLPFPFPFFGKAYMSVGVASNGYLQFQGTNSMVLLDPNNKAIPSAAPPNNVVAVIWDDLVPPGGTGSATVHTGLRGAAPAREFVVQWTGWSTFGASPPSVMTFQAVLAESGEIDFVYCTLASTSDPERATGASATVGLENETGTAGVQHSVDKAKAIAAGQILRFYPAP